MKIEEVEKALNLAQAELRAMYKRLGINGSNVLDIVDNALKEIEDSGIDYEPYMGWCDVEGCNNEVENQGCCWEETGYWKVCGKHSAEHREGKSQPKMKQSAIDRENQRGVDGVLPLSAINK